MVLLASNFDKSKYLKAADLDKEKKFGSRARPTKLSAWATTRSIGSFFGSPMTSAGSFSIAPISASCAKRLATLSIVGSARSSSVYPTSVDFRGKLVPALRVRIPPPKQPAAATSPQPASSGNGAAAAAAPPKASAAPADPELADEPQKPLREELDDEIPF